MQLKEIDNGTSIDSSTARAVASGPYSIIDR